VTFDRTRQECVARDDEVVADAVLLSCAQLYERSLSANLNGSIFTVAHVRLLELALIDFRSSSC
jgi:hypothetical protein